MKWSSNQAGVTDKQLFDLATFSATDLIAEVYVR